MIQNRFGDFDDKLRTVTGDGGNVDEAAMLRDNFLWNEQSQAVALVAFGGKKQGKELFPGFPVHARAGVGDLKKDVIGILFDPEYHLFLFFRSIPIAGIHAVFSRNHGIAQVF